MDGAKSESSEGPVVSVKDSVCRGDGSCCKENNQALTPLSLVYSMIPVVDAYVTPLSLCKREAQEENAAAPNQHFQLFDVEVPITPISPETFTSIDVENGNGARSAACSAAGGGRCCTLNRGIVSAGRCATAIVSPPKTGSSTNLLEETDRSSSMGSVAPKRAHCSVCGILFVVLAVGAIVAAAIALYIELVVKPDAAGKIIMANMMKNSSGSHSEIDPLTLPEKVRDFIVQDDNIQIEVSTQRSKPTGVPLNLSGKTQVKFSEDFLSALHKVEKPTKNSEKN